MTTNEWIQTISTIVLAATAFAAPYIIEKWKFTYQSPKLNIKFKLKPPYCHLTQMRGENIDSPVYYFRFLVENIGKSQADDCEVFLEELYKQNSAGEMIKIENFTSVNLKWSGMRDGFKRTLQPGRQMFCDIGRIQEPRYNYISVYRAITPTQQEQLKFVFELPEKYYSQWDCLLKGTYKLLVSIYSKNANKITHEFKISWSGEWKNSEEEMFNELVIT